MLAALLMAAIQNAISNGGFESVDGSNPSSWTQRTWSGRGSFALTEGRTGRGAQIISEAGGDVSWSVKVPVRKASWYRLSGWIKTIDLRPSSGNGAQLNVHELGSARTPSLNGTTEWTKVETVFRTGDLAEITVNCLFGGWGQATGKAVFDDISLEPIDMSQTTLAYSIRQEPRHPISPYVYGQFIEHLGRCIQGGIWAEMLEDRKFHFPVTEKFAPWADGKEPGPEFAPVLVASPWKVSRGSVSMVAGTGWTHQPVPEIRAGAIEQSWLQLEQGKRYLGRVVWQGDPITIKLGPNAQTEASLRAPQGEFGQMNFSLTAADTTSLGYLSIATEGTARVAAVSLMPEDHVQGFRKDVIELLRQLNSPIYRWPGGNFASGYDWRDGLGDPDKRPSSPNPAWTGVETNDVGIHEFMAFCKLVGTEPLVVVNTGFGDAVSAAQWVEYCNSSTSTAMGTWRAKNGSEKPFDVRWWGVGNEMYGSWQLGHIPVAQYWLKHNQTVDRMRRIDPTIKTVGVGARGSWDDTIIPRSKEHMTLLSQHHYWQERSDPMDHILQARSTVADLARYSREKLKGTNLKIAFDEYNYWYGPHVFGELGTRYFQKDGLGIAVALHEMFRNSDVFEMAMYAQTVNVIGAIKATRKSSFFETTGHVLALYRRDFGTEPLTVDGGAPFCDVVAALTADRKYLTIAAVNALDKPVNVKIATGVTLGSGTRFRIESADPNAYNSADQPDRIPVTTQAGARLGESETLPPYSLTLWRLPVAGRAAP